MKIAVKLRKIIVLSKLRGRFHFPILCFNSFLTEKVGWFWVIFGKLEGKADSKEKIKEKEVPLVGSFEEQLEEVSLIGIYFHFF